MKNQPTQLTPTSAGLHGILRLTAGLVILALAALASLEIVPLEQVVPHGRRIVLLAIIVALAAAGIAGLVRWGRRS